MTSYELLIQKLDDFTRKYYLNKVYRGLLILVGIFVTVFVVFNLLEFTLYLPSSVRLLMFYSFIIGAIGVLAGYIVMPFLKYFKLGDRIDDHTSARIIGDHFEEVQDKLLNVLQLKNQHSGTSNDLINASIEQKAQDIKLVPFTKAVDMKQTARIGRFALIPVLLLAVLWMGYPRLFSEGTYRIVNNQKEFTPPAPFEFLFSTDDKPVLESEDLPIEVKIQGSEIPIEADIVVDDVRYRMRPDGKGQFTFLLPNVQPNTQIRFESGSVKSPTYDLNVHTRPVLSDFTVRLSYPSYTGKPNETLENTGDLLVPVGTKAIWDMSSQAADYLYLSPWMKKTESLLDQFSKTLLKNQKYSIQYGRDEINYGDSLQFDIQVIPDLFPSIEVKEFTDHPDEEVRFFAGEVGDDYGLSNVYMVYHVLDPNNQVIRRDSSSIFATVESGIFEYQLRSERLGLSPGQSAQIFFSAYDNDAVHGAKRATSEIFQMHKLSQDEMEERQERSEDEMISDLTELMKKQEKITKKAKELRDDLLNEKEIDWKNEKLFNELQKEQENIKKNTQELQKNFDEMQSQNEEMEESLEEQKKEELIEEMLDNLEDPKLEELLEKIKDLMQKQKKDEAIEELNQLQQQSEQEEMDYERLLELYKKLEVETDFQDQMDKIAELAKEEKKLSEQDPDNTQKQKELQEEFNKTQEKLEEIKEKNKDLKKPIDIPDTKPDAQEINMNMQEGMNQENSTEQKKEHQKKAAEQMQQMAQQMNASMSQSGEEQVMEDMKMIRQMLENLVTFSFDQEDIFNKTNRFKSLSPEYRDLVRSQQKLSQDWKHMRDTLVEISLRQAAISPFINEKISEIDQSFELLINFLEDRKQSQATVHERRIMTNTNDLALMMDESMQNLQQQMSQPNAMCKNPGKNKGQGNASKPGQQEKISQGQEKLNDQMKEMHEKMMQQIKEGREQEKMSSKDYAEMAAKQAALRKAVEEKAKELQERGKKNEDLEKIGDEMNKIETELVNKKLTKQMLNRQQNILSKMLDYEKAERQQDMDEQRQAIRAKELPKERPAALQEYLQERKSQKIEYKTVPAELKPFYQRLITGYYDKIKGQN